MASAAEVVEGLEKTGTGEGYLRQCREFLREHRDASGTDLVEWLRMERNNALMSGEATFGPQPTTIAKAEHLAAGRPIGELMGKPPPRPNPMDSPLLAGKMDQLIELIRQTGEERAAAVQQPVMGQVVGNPTRPPQMQKAKRD